MSKNTQYWFSIFNEAAAEIGPLEPNAIRRLCGDEVAKIFLQWWAMKRGPAVPATVSEKRPVLW